MKANDKIFVLIFAWLIILTYGYVHIQGSIMFIIGELSDIYNMIGDVYKHITNILNMGVIRWL